MYATVFARAGDDFVRVTTSHKKENGQRAVGTVLDHAHPAYAPLSTGKSYAGAAALFGGQYMTQYDPITDAGGKVIGILYVGVNFTESMKSLAEGVRAMRLGDSGPFYALSAKPGKDYGKAMIHAALENQNLLDTKDHGGREYVKEMLDKKNGDLRYQGDDAGRARERIVAFSYSKSWNMLVVGDVYLEAINQMDIATQQNAALVEEAAAASGSLHGQADNLSRVVQVFKLDGVRQIACASAAQAAPAQARRMVKPVVAGITASNSGRFAQARKSTVGEPDWEEF